MDRRIDVHGKFWNFNRDRTRDEEGNTLFKCTVLGFHDFHKWDGGGVPSQGMKFQDIPYHMDVDS